jgi:hypothetical protein
MSHAFLFWRRREKVGNDRAAICPIPTDTDDETDVRTSKTTITNNEKSIDTAALWNPFSNKPSFEV